MYLEAEGTKPVDICTLLYVSILLLEMEGIWRGRDYQIH